MDVTSLWSWSSTVEEGNCAVCKQTTKSRCATCRAVYYCSKEHQELHWQSDHKKNCGTIVLANDPHIGRHYIAKRDIECGEIVLREKGPLVNLISNSSNYPVCVNCYTNQRGQEEKICGKCGWWPLCPKCEEHGSECEFTIKYGKFKDLPDKGKAARADGVQNVAIGIIRILALRETNRRAYSKFMKHADHQEKIKALYGDQLDTDIAKLVLRYFNIDSAEESQMAKINRILLISAFGTGDRSYFAEKTSYFEHDCRPNCSKTIPDDANNGSFLVFAVRPIAAGEHVSLCYNNGDMGTMNRKDWLASTKFFDCNCARCEDPTEYGMMFNTLKCVKRLCTGNILPESFKKSNGRYPDFVCRECQSVITSEMIISLQRDIGNQFTVISEADANGYLRFIEDNITILHRNHFYMIKAKLKLADVIGFDAYNDTEPDMVPDAILDKKIDLSNEISELHELLMPGYTRCRGRLLYGTSVALGEKIKRAGPNWDVQAFLRTKIMDTLTETCRLLCYESASSEEGQMAREAMKLLQMARSGTL